MQQQNSNPQQTPSGQASGASTPSKPPRRKAVLTLVVLVVIFVAVLGGVQWFDGSSVVHEEVDEQWVSTRSGIRVVQQRTGRLFPSFEYSVFATSDSGRNWQPVLEASFDRPQPIFDTIGHLHKTLIWLWTPTQLAVSPDAAQTWTTWATEDIAQYPSARITDVTFETPSAGTMQLETDGKRITLRTEDTGRTWTSESR